MNLKSKPIEMDKSNLAQKIAQESELVKAESMLILKEFEAIDNIELDEEMP